MKATALEALRKEVKDGGVAWISDAWLARLIDAILADRALLAPSSGTELPSPDGKGRWFLTNGGTGSGSGTIHPFKLLNASDDEGFKIRVVYGTVNGVEPIGMSPGDVPPYVLTVVVTGYVYLVLTCDLDGVITSLTIDQGTSVPDDDVPALTFYHLIGSFNIADETITLAQSISGSQAFALCGEVEPEWGLV